MIARIQKSMKAKDQGFTLIELLVVMIIIGILAAIAIPVFLNQRQKAVDASVKSDLKAAATSVETASVDGQTYPAAMPADVQESPQNVLTYSGGGATFCIGGYNPNGTADAAGNSYWYVSNDGGLQPTAGGKPTICP